MKYMQVSGNDGNSGLCSDDACPCGSPGATIPRGEGYVYVSKEVVDFRMDCPAEAQAQIKIQRMSAQMSSVIFAGAGVFSPIVMCEQGAKKRGLDLEVAAADARHWWDKGQVPLRPTPLAGAKQARAAVPAPVVTTAPPITLSQGQSKRGPQPSKVIRLARNGGSFGSRPLLRLQ